MLMLMVHANYKYNQRTNYIYKLQSSQLETRTILPTPKAHIAYMVIRFKKDKLGDGKTFTNNFIFRTS